METAGGIPPGQMEPICNKGSRLRMDGSPFYLPHPDRSGTNGNRCRLSGPPAPKGGRKSFRRFDFPCPLQRQRITVPAKRQGTEGQEASNWQISVFPLFTDRLLQWTVFRLELEYCCCIHRRNHYGFFNNPRSARSDRTGIDQLYRTVVSPCSMDLNCSPISWACRSSMIFLDWLKISSSSSLI